MFERPGWWVAILVFYFWKEVNDVKVKIMAALLVLVIGLSCLGVSEVRADEKSGISSFFNKMGWDIPDEIDLSYEHVVTYYPDDDVYHIIGKKSAASTFFFIANYGDDRFSLYLDDIEDMNNTCAFYRFVFQSDGSYEININQSDARWTNVVSSRSVSCEYDSLQYGECNLDDFILFADSDIGTGYYLRNDYGYPDFVSVGQLPDPVYNPELGYLQNLIEKTVYLRDSEGHIDYSTYQRIVGFDSLSTSGLDLSTGEYSIRVYEQGCYYGHDVTTVYKDDYPLIYIGEYAIENNSITYDPWEAREKTTTETEGWLSDWDLYWGQYERRDNMYYQIVKTNDDGSIEYGGYVKVVRLTDNDDGISSTVTPELVPDTDGGFSDDRVDSGIGSGTNYEDAEMNADQDLENNINNPDVSGDIAKDIQSLIAYIGAVPQLLSALLSFLPEEYQQLIFVAFALMLGLIVIKTVRG